MSWRHAWALAAAVLLGGCTGGDAVSGPSTGSRRGVASAMVSASPSRVASTSGAAARVGSNGAARVAQPRSPRRGGGSTPAGLVGMPPVTNPRNVYSQAGAGMILPPFRSDPADAYVPHNRSGDVWVIDQRTHKVVNRCHVGAEIQHVIPSYDLKTLYATDDVGNVIRAIDPRTGRCGRTIPVKDPYNMYFTPDGRYAISVAEQYRQLVWYDPVTWRRHDTTSIPACSGIDHADFSADGRTAVFTCEFAGRVAVVDVGTHRVLRTVDMPVQNTMMGPQDIKLAPDGRAYYIADSDSNGVWVLDGAARRVLRYIATGLGAHGLYLSRDAARLFVTNRLEGSVSVLDAYTGAVKTKWRIPGGGSPDMGNVNADGTQLWISGRYNNVVYVIDTRNGHLISKIHVGEGPHGLALMPLPGRYSLGHTGITR